MPPQTVISFTERGHGHSACLSPPACEIPSSIVESAVTGTIGASQSANWTGLMMPSACNRSNTFELLLTWHLRGGETGPKGRMCDVYIYINSKIICHKSTHNSTVMETC